MPRYGNEYDREFGRRQMVRDGWGYGQERMRGGYARYDEPYRRDPRQARGPGRPEAGGRMRGYDREQSRGGGAVGPYGASMYGGGRYGGDYLGAWGPGGWSAQHGQEHAGVRNAERYGREFLRERERRRYWDPAPTS